MKKNKIIIFGFSILTSICLIGSSVAGNELNPIPNETSNLAKKLVFSYEDIFEKYYNYASNQLMEKIT